VAGVRGLSILRRGCPRSRRCAHGSAEAPVTAVSINTGTAFRNNSLPYTKPCLGYEGSSTFVHDLRRPPPPFSGWRGRTYTKSRYFPVRDFGTDCGVLNFARRRYAV
jgi:hypothetical protein